MGERNGEIPLAKKVKILVKKYEKATKVYNQLTP